MARKKLKPLALLYVRQETENKVRNDVKTSLNFQETILREYCSLKGYEVVKVFKDIGANYVLNLITPSCELANLISYYNGMNIRNDDKQEVIILAIDMETFSKDIGVQSVLSEIILVYQDFEPVTIETVKEGVLGTNFEYKISFNTDIELF